MQQQDRPFLLTNLSPNELVIEFFGFNHRKPSSLEIITNNRLEIGEIYSEMTLNSDVYFVETGHVVFVGFLEKWMDILPDHFFRIHFAPQSFGLRWKQNQRDEESQHLGPEEVEFVGLDHFHD